MPVVSQIPKGTATNFQTLQDANKRDSLVLLRVFDKVADKEATLICAINIVEGKYEFIPLAIMIEEDPFERFEPPS